MIECKAESFAERGVVAIIRGVTGEELFKLTDALIAGGIQLIELTLDTNGAFGLIQLLAEKYSRKAMIGAGTVLDADSAKAAIHSGAEFIVSPHSDEKIISAVKKEGMLSIPGAFTPSEMMEAYQAGADYIKLFPAGYAGAEYIRQIRTPLPHIPILATGGIHSKNMGDFLEAGANALGFGSSLYTVNLLANNEFDKIAFNARQLIQQFRNNQEKGKIYTVLNN
ncbi:bifunctional 4-hydroxy-2-oxoglutarate aldolase/2-dehydro-3-deoxy-phosphogluconate aldolase [Metabacillus sp. RGM 3146]|uniref:bifunctional 4-hydroxy-2-oxoglutarate aldolase/2-dehydro-3-deoxy-phosphogluconate aldolase n=1 Tax=Metabacillus sp. RGM 3146 TaxID=3401092 RepID=UPI003B9A770D